MGVNDCGQQRSPLSKLSQCQGWFLVSGQKRWQREGGDGGEADDVQTY